MVKTLRLALHFSILIVFTIAIGCPILNRAFVIRTNSHLDSMEANRTYVINKEIDLQGRFLKLPDNDTLLFKGGILKNGKIEGNNTVIFGGRKLLFKNVELSGTWSNETVYSEWLEFSTDSLYDNRSSFVNLMALCKGQNPTIVYLKEDNYWTSVNKNGSALSIPSNTRFIFRGAIYELPNNYERASLIRLYNVDNVIIDGGKYIGDVESHLGKEGEWSHGISLWGASDITIKNVECSYFWGDGIDLIEAFDNDEQPVYNCENIVIDSCVCYYNRRQGLSIESGKDVIVKNSKFSFTGTKGSTPPAAGIDIEAWSKNNAKIARIRIESCEMRGNIGYSLQSYANAVFGDNFYKYPNIIVVNNCDMDNILINRTSDILITNSIIREERIERNSQKVRFVNCSK